MKPSIELNTKRLNLTFDEILARVEQHHMISMGKQDLLATYLAANGINPSRAVIIGDSLEEYEIAESLGVQPIIITNGFVAENRMSHIPPHSRVHSSQLLNKLKQINYETV